MIILGLGSNLGDRLNNLRLAFKFIQTLPHLSVTQVSPLYISDALMPDGAPPDWNIPYFNLAIRCETTLEPYELLRLIKDIEVKVGREPNKKWGPRIIDIDLLVWDDFIQYDKKLHIPHEGLLERPFALWPLADIAPRWVFPIPGVYQGKTASELTQKWGSKFTGEAPFRTRQIQQRIDTPELVGIINISPDSFSDGGNIIQSWDYPGETNPHGQSNGETLTSYRKLSSLKSSRQAAWNKFEIEHAIYKAHQLLEAGATILDIGAEATGPKATPITAKEEWSRLYPILKTLVEDIKHSATLAQISVDTRHAETAECALELGIDWINDVSGLNDPRMRAVLRNAACDIVMMHNLGVPVSQTALLPAKQDPGEAVLRWAQEKLALFDKEAILSKRIIFDIGIGYGKSAEQSLELLKQIELFKTLGVRLLVGHSRKSFLQQFTHHLPQERDLETTVLSLYLAQKEVEYLRVHNVEMHSRAFKVTKVLKQV